MSQLLGTSSSLMLLFIYTQINSHTVKVNVVWGSPGWSSSSCAYNMVHSEYGGWVQEVDQVRSSTTIPSRLTRISPNMMMLLSKRFIERNILKCYKVQPLIMRSHNQNLERHHFPIFLSSTLIWIIQQTAQHYESMINSRFPGCHRAHFAIFKTFGRVSWGHHTAQYFSAKCVTRY